MSQPDHDRSSARRILSALADGDATESEASRAFQSWREDGDARATWHAYQLIGDAMRSDDLASVPARDENFLVALRARLATEPVVLAPLATVDENPVDDGAVAVPAVQLVRPVGAAAFASAKVANVAFAQDVTNGAPTRAAGRARSRWQAPLAMAAGFLAVIGAIDVMRPSGHPVDVASAAPSSAAPGFAASGGLVATSAQAKADADQLAPYLAAHRQSTMNGAFQMPGADLRNVSMVQSAP